jgi:hypothetical protein
MQTEGNKINRDITISVDTVMSESYIGRVPDRFEIAERMRQRLLHECRTIAAGRERIKSDVEAYHRVRDEMEQIAAREERVNRILGVLGLHESGRILEEEEDLARAINQTLTFSPTQLRERLSLWEAMREYLQYVPEARIAEMEDFFSAVKMSNANRQAMESALKRHPETFKIRKDGREKYISLKSRAQKGVL